MRSESELHELVEAIYSASDHLDDVNYLGRLWIASYAAAADILADCMLELLNGAAVPECVFGMGEAAE